MTPRLPYHCPHCNIRGLVRGISDGQTGRKRYYCECCRTLLLFWTPGQRLLDVGIYLTAEFIRRRYPDWGMVRP